MCEESVREKWNEGADEWVENHGDCIDFWQILTVYNKMRGGNFF